MRQLYTGAGKKEGRFPDGLLNSYSNETRIREEGNANCQKRHKQELLYPCAVEIYVTNIGYR